VIHHLRSGATSLVVDASSGVPAVVWWGRSLGELDDDALAEVAAAARPPVTQGSLDSVVELSLVPEHGSGFPGHPGLLGSRADGTAWAPRFTPGHVEVTASSLVARATDSVAALQLDTQIETTEGGGFRVRLALTNEGSDRYDLGELSISVAVPPHAGELLTFEGRWCRELDPTRRLFTTGAVVAENRRGRTSHDNIPLVWAGTAGFGEESGEVWGAHLAWSGNSRVAAERLPDGRCRFQLGELLHPGEVVLEAGDTYTTPWVVLAAGDGLSAASRVFHGYVRSLPPLAGVRRRGAHRPVTLNVWEAVYFDHDGARLAALAERAASVGVERFVLDDGWFGGRRDDTAGLGDWWVSPAAHPDGLAPLIETVRGLGMEFGIWIEPEMVNPDSDLYREHPEWALVTDGYEPVLARNQLVLDLARPEAFETILSQLHALLGDHDISYVKWDMNRDHVQGSARSGRAGTHEQTLAFYRLLDELRGRHPAVEFESCASGGGRIDHGVLERAERVWTSDCNDALERQTIQRYATTFIPLEVLGAHVGPPRAHTTGRTHSLGFRAGTALFGHFGIEWNLLDATADELDELRWWVDTYKRHRPLLHDGDLVRVDTDGARAVYGVVAADRGEALFAHAQLTTSNALAPPPVRLTGLDEATRYRVTVLGDADRPDAVLTGRQLATHGLRLGTQLPETVVLFHVVAEP
jgi:alpha-galactosidase